MLDKRTENLLSIINRLCEEGSYKVLEAEELISLFPKNYKIDGEGLSDMVNYLCEREFIKLKYSDGKVYCLSPLPKGRLYHENLMQEIREKFSYRKLVLAAFLGSILGGILGAAVHAFVISLL